MTNLPPYSGPRQCVKCRHGDPTSEYRATIPLISRCGGDTVETRTHEGLPTQECLLRSCRSCGWAWVEACADTAPAPVAQSTIYPPGAGSGARLEVLASGAMRMYNTRGDIVYDNQRDDALRSVSALGVFSDTRPHEAFGPSGTG